MVELIPIFITTALVALALTSFVERRIKDREKQKVPVKAETPRRRK